MSRSSLARRRVRRRADPEVQRRKREYDLEASRQFYRSLVFTQLQRATQAHAEEKFDLEASHRRQAFNLKRDFHRLWGESL